MSEEKVQEIKRNEMKRLNQMIQKLDYLINSESSYVSFADIRQLRVYLYDLKLRIIKEQK